MFSFGGKESLPVHGANKSNGVSLSTININVVLSLLWIISSIIIVYLGNTHCKVYSINSSLICDEKTCDLISKQVDGQLTKYTFSQVDFIDSEITRVKDGKVISTVGVSRKISSSYGYSVMIKFKSPVEDGSRIKVQSSVLLSPYDTGRRSARSTVSKIDRYIEGKSKELNLVIGQTWTVFGTLLIISGFVSLVCSFIFGQFSDPAPRRMRKSK